MIRLLRRTMAFAVCLFGAGASADPVAIGFDSTLDVRGTEFAYNLDMTLSVAAPTRIGINALLDLRDVQARLPDIAAGQTILNLCGNQTRIAHLDILAEDDDVRITGQLASEFFECSSDNNTDFKRGASRSLIELDFEASASVNLRENCVVFSLIDLDVIPLDVGFESNENIETARGLMISAIALILQESPVCPKLPENLASLDPEFRAGGPQEIGEGGLGVFLSGSVDVSTRTLIDLLKVLQEADLLPPSP